VKISDTERVRYGKDRHRLSQVNAPDSETVRAALRKYLGVMDLTAGQFAERVRRGESTVNAFLLGYYRTAGCGDSMIRKQIWDYLERFPISADVGMPPNSSGRLFQTKQFYLISGYFAAACDQGAVCLLHGPPGTQKSYALTHLIAERNREKKNPALYIYATVDMPPRSLLKRIGREAGVFTNVASIERLLSSILAEFRLQKRPPAIVVDEAQHLGISSLEICRELCDRSGCGLILAGSHNLFQNFLRGRAHLEQWLSRIDHKDPLPGLLEEEVREISTRELGNGEPAKLSEVQLKKIVAACSVEDIFARGEDGKPHVAKYFSVRRLAKFLGQVKKKKAEVAA
jgi:DNA transposition AAA+ family ATPase